MIDLRPQATSRGQLLALRTCHSFNNVSMIDFYDVILYRYHDAVSCSECVRDDSGWKDSGQ